MTTVESPVKGRVRFSIDADEIIDPAATITVQLPAAVDAQNAQGAVRLTYRGDEVPVDIGLLRNGRAIRVGLRRPKCAPSGPYVLEVGELLSVRGRRINEVVRVPFLIAPIVGKVRSGLRVVHSVRLEFDDLTVNRLRPGESGERGHVDVVKAVDRETGAHQELAFDERGEAVNLQERFAELDKKRADKFGKLDPTLYRRLASDTEPRQVPVVIWARIELPPAPYQKDADRRSVQPPEEEVRVTALVRAAMDRLMRTLDRYKVAVQEDSPRDQGLPFVWAEVAADEVRELSGEDAVGAIYLDDRTAINDLDDSITIARSDHAHALGFDGTGVRVAVFESGPSVTTNLSFAGRFTNNPSASSHARLTSAVVKNTEPGAPHGHAPDCDLYSANSSSNDALLWAVRDQHCTVISQSFHRASEPGGSGLQGDDVLKDWLALRWPYPTIVAAAGNFWNGDPDDIDPPQDEYVNHKGYNTLSVGNHNDSAGAMSGSSVFRNPATSHGDRELPEISANGTGVSAVGENSSGTSFAAPAVAGVVALLQDVDPVLMSWPEGCRAILMAAAGRNVRGGTWWQDVSAGIDGRDGAGAVDANSGVAIAGQRRRRNSSAARHGWDVGTLSSSSFGQNGMATFTYRIAVPRLLIAPRVKVALAWDSAVATFLNLVPLLSGLTVDLDLIVRDSNGVTVASSASWDNSYEIVEFAATRGETYEIVIRRWSGTDDVWFGLAWTVRGTALTLPFDNLLEPRAIS